MSLKIKKFKRLLHDLSIFKLYKKYIYSKIINFKINTVHVRGRLNFTNLEFKEKYGGLYIKNIKQIIEKIEQNKINNLENILEIGFGDGEHLLNLARENEENKGSEYNKNKFIIGLELYTLGIVLAAKKIHKAKLENINLIELDARDFIDKLAKFQNTFESIYVLFPDPWRKKRHNKRRLVKKEFISKLLNLLKKEGKLIIATDWQDYADEIESYIQDLNYEKVRIESVYRTAFAKRAVREGREIIIFQVNN